jgi:alpha-L-fucosidase
MVNPERVPFPGASAPGVTEALLHGDASGTIWRPAEADVSIRPGWFYHASEDARVRTSEQLIDLYFSSVGRNSKLLLNVPPTRDGLLHPTDVARLAGFSDRLRALFRNDLTAGQGATGGTWRLTGERTAELEIDLGRSARVAIARLEENIARGQRVARYALSGYDGSAWRELSRGTTIGYARLDRFERAQVRRVRLTIEDAIAAPERVRVRLFAGTT